MTKTTLLIPLLLAQVANAQQSVIDHCKQTSSDTDRIACLEAALLGKELSQPEETQSQIDPPSLELDAGPADETIEEIPKTKPAGIGAAQVIVRNQTREDMLEQLEEEHNLPVARYHIVPYERLVVTLENGQQWRQIKGDNQKIRVDLKRNQSVDITESPLGGYKLRLNEMRRTIRVERVK